MFDSVRDEIADIISNHYTVKGCAYCVDCFDKCHCGHFLGEDTIEQHKADVIMHFISTRTKD